MEATKMNNAIQTYNSRNSFSLNTWELIERMAPVLHASRILGISSKEQAMTIMLKGLELGFGFAASFEFIDVIDGRPNLSPRGALALIHDAQKYGILDKFETKRLVEKGEFYGYEVTMKRGVFEHTARFTLDDAKRAHLTEGSPTGSGKRGYGNWEKYPENMCLWRAIGFAADVVCPDITGGLTTFLKMPEAFPSVTVDAEGNFERVIEGEIVSDSKPKVGEALHELITQYGAEAILEANNGVIPNTLDEITLVIEKLES
jgi:hypothetical protein